MAARGAEEKQIIIDKILQTFENSFIDGKEVRVPINDVQIKLSFVCAKENIGGDNVTSISAFGDTSVTPTETVVTEPTDEEKERVKTLLEKLSF